MKRFLLIGLMVVVMFLGIGCAPNLVFYPPIAINPIVVEGLQNFRISSQVPSEEYGIAFKNVIERNKNAVLVYHEKLFPFFSQEYQRFQKKDYDGISAFIAKARVYNAESFNSYRALKSALEELSEVNKKINDSAIKTKTGQVVDFGKEIVDRMLNIQNTTRKLWDVFEGYDRARVKKNLSFLTKENEQRFNQLSQSLHESNEKLNKEAEVLFRLFIELNELLSKGGG